MDENEMNGKNEAAVTPHDTRYLFVLPFSTDRPLARRFLASDRLIAGNIRFGQLVLESTRRAYPEQENIPKTVFGSYVNPFWVHAR